jgi:hypothetical protein
MWYVDVVGTGREKVGTFCFEALFSAPICSIFALSDCPVALVEW